MKRAEEKNMCAYGMRSDTEYGRRYHGSHLGTTITSRFFLNKKNVTTTNASTSISHVCVAKCKTNHRSKRHGAFTARPERVVHCGEDGTLLLVGALVGCVVDSSRGRMCALLRRTFPPLCRATVYDRVSLHER